MTDDYHLVPIDQIVVGSRFRKEIDDNKIVDLATELKTDPLLNPITLHRDGRLIAGQRRILAFKKLGRTEIPAHYLDEINDLQALELELAENVQRQDMSWIEVVRLREAIHRIKIEKYGQATTQPNKTGDPRLDGWSTADTASILGVQRRSVFQDLALAAAVEMVPELAEEASKSVALKKVDRLIEDIQRELELRDAIAAKVEVVVSSLWLGDCINEMEKIPTGSVGCIITDPPYGTDYDSVGGTGHRTEAQYDDSPESVLALLRSAAREMRRVLRPDGHLYAFFGIQLWSETIATYSRAGFNVDPLPLVWIKNRGGTVDWDKRYSPSWEPILFATNKERRLARKRSNVFAFDSPATRVHANEKPTDLLREIIGMSTQPDELVLDPFCGSGSTLEAARSLGRRWIGIELDPRMYDIAKLRMLR